MKATTKTYVAEAQRDLDDGLALSKEALEKVQAAALDSFKNAMVEAFSKDGILPRKIRATFTYEIEGADIWETPK